VHYKWIQTGEYLLSSSTVCADCEASLEFSNFGIAIIDRGGDSDLEATRISEQLNFNCVLLVGILTVNFGLIWDL